MKRGEIWTVAGGTAYAGEPRPAVIIQDDRFDASDSVVVCPITSDLVAAPVFRIRAGPDDENGLRRACPDRHAALCRARSNRWPPATVQSDLYSPSVLLFPPGDGNVGCGESRQRLFWVVR